MRWRFALGVALWSAVALPAIRAQSAAELKELAAQRELDKEELMNLQRETARAVQLHNGSFFRRVYSDDFVGVAPSGQVTDKAGFVSMVETSRLQYTSVIPTDIRIRIYESTAVVTSLWTVRAMREGAGIYRQSRLMIVYVTSPRGWVAVASQETQLPG